MYAACAADPCPERQLPWGLCTVYSPVAHFPRNLYRTLSQNLHGIFMESSWVQQFAATTQCALLLATEAAGALPRVFYSTGPRWLSLMPFKEKGGH